MSCNPSCPNYIVSCTNYSYVCPSCTDCCKEIINAKCVKYKSTDLSCIGVETDDTLEDVIKAVNTLAAATICATYNIQCLGGASNASLNTTIQALIDDVCTENNNLFDTSCLGGDVDVSIYTAVSDIITKICASSTTYPSFDTSCLTDGEAVDTLQHAVELLLINACDGQTCTLEWGGLTHVPDEELNTPICDILAALILNILCNKITFSSDFVATEDCPRAVSLDYEVVSEGVLTEIEGSSTLTEQFNDIVGLRVFGSETSGPNSLEEVLAFSSEMSATNLPLQRYTYTLTIPTTTGTLDGFVTPTGITHWFNLGPSTSPNLSNATAMQTTLNNLGIGTFTVTIVLTTITISVVMDGDSTTYYPSAIYNATSYSTMGAALQDANWTNYLLIGMAEPNDWVEATFSNGWTSYSGTTIKYRLNTLNNSIEVSGGSVSRVLDAAELTASTPISETLFSIGAYTSTDLNTQWCNTLTNTAAVPATATSGACCIYAPSVTLTSQQVSTRIDSKVYINGGSSNVNLSIIDPLRVGSVASETLIVTIPSFVIWL